jgi:periplasmic divalent cation tolerance protein
VDAFIIVFVTASSREEAEKIARQLVEGGAAPCVNIIPSCVSIYEWKGEVHRDEECLMVIKTKKSIFPKVMETVQRVHSYDVPEIIAVDLAEISETYRAYLEGYFK